MNKIRQIVSLADLTYQGAARLPEHGLPLGNGRMGSLIWLTPNQTYPHVWTMLKRIGDKPLVPISVGVQSMARNVDITLHPDTVKLLRTMAERAVLGVRGEYTAAVLEKNGIVNFRIIGCPSLYQGMNEKFRVEKKPIDPAMRAC